MILPLPAFTFLNGPNGCGKSTLAAALADRDPGLAIISFAEPIREALMATFYDQNDPLDLRDENVKSAFIPGTGMIHRRWMISFGQWMKSLMGEQIFGDLAKRKIEELTHFYNRFVFDDNRYEEEIRPIVNGFGGEHCLLIHLERPGTSFSGANEVGRSLTHLMGLRHVGLINRYSNPDDLVAALGRALGSNPGGLHVDQQTPLLESGGSLHPNPDEPPPSTSLDDL